jgi:hypothetical protein
LSAPHTRPVSEGCSGTKERRGKRKESIEYRREKRKEKKGVDKREI